MGAKSTGVVKVVPVSKGVPPPEAANQDMVPELAVACSTIDPELQVPAGVTDVMVGKGIIVAMTGVRKADVQPLAVTST